MRDIEDQSFTQGLTQPWFYAISGPQAFSLRGIDLIK